MVFKYANPSIIPKRGIMASAAFYIPSTGRPEMAADCVSRLAKLNTDMEIVVVVRKGESKSYLRGIREYTHAYVEELPGRGIGYTRHEIINMAAEDVVIMLDDDKTVKGDIKSWINVAAREDCVSVGAWQSIYGLYCSGTAIAKGADSGKTFLHRGVMGNQVVALNRQNVIEAGNYPPEITFFEDHELCRKTMVNLRLPWMIYAGVTGGSIKPTNQTRGPEQGGNSRSAEDRHFAHEFVHNAWPEYVSPANKRYQCKWKDMVRKYIHLKGGAEIDNMTTKAEWDWEAEYELPRRQHRLAGNPCHRRVARQRGVPGIPEPAARPGLGADQQGDRRTGGSNTGVHRLYRPEPSQGGDQRKVRSPVRAGRRYLHRHPGHAAPNQE